MNRWLAAMAMTMAIASPGGSAEKAGPYVNVFRDDTVLFQVRRDRVTHLGENRYRVWLRWLWAQPRSAQGGVETATIVVGEIDCTALRVRELALMRKGGDGKYFEVHETPPEHAPWNAFTRESPMARVCTFLPELMAR